MNLILESLNARLLDNGRWVNVIGYLQSSAQVRAKGKRRSVGASEHGKGQDEYDEMPVVQTVLMWDAGAVRATEYEKTLEKQREAWRKTRHIHHQGTA